MIGLPTSLNVAGEEYPIRTDYRVILTIFAAFNDPNLNDREKFTVCLNCLYKVIPANYEEAMKQAMWFIDGAELPGNGSSVRLMDWEQDEGMIFAAVNRVAGKEIRAVEYMHWWTFLGFFYELAKDVSRPSSASGQRWRRESSLPKRSASFSAITVIRLN